MRFSNNPKVSSFFLKSSQRLKPDYFQGQANCFIVAPTTMGDSPPQDTPISGN